MSYSTVLYHLAFNFNYHELMTTSNKTGKTK